ncbi:MAG: cytochrome c3 family protein [Thioalkalispiraceae bacterium]
MFLLQTALLVFAVLLSGTSLASIESLIMPGKVIKDHAKYEQDCHKCHDRFDRKNQKAKCLDCHKKIRSDVKKRQGLHGHKMIVRTQECNTCHKEHKGRAADIVKLNKLTFDHSVTDFRLRGEHKKINCDNCHKPRKKYREAPHACISCHRSDSPHKAATMGKIINRCDSCHNETSWRTIRYKHKKSKFPHTGKHKKTDCNACHISDRYVKTPTKCISCHRSDDVHRGSNGTKCQKCHSTRSWKKLDFDHDKDTDFPLRGRHDRLACGDCHKKDPYKVKIKSSCISCHQHDDAHKGLFGKKCETCHTERTWQKNKFNHSKDTKFRLRGKHTSTACTSCHKTQIYKTKLKTDCYSCHKIDDVHKGKQGKNCKNCHNEKGWRTKVRFEHDITRFPLVGLHSIVPCEECHISSEYKKASIKCNSCHERDDIHKGRLGQDCQTCHNPNGWAIWRFDHNKQSRFKLDGAHTKVHCYNCHISAVDKIESKPRTCIACHRADDEHNGQFGPRCGRCHNTKTFRDVHFRR